MTDDDDELARARTDETVDDATRLARLANVYTDLPNIPLDALLIAYRRSDGTINGISYGDIAAIVEINLRLTERLDRIAGWHSRETGPAGMVGDLCRECGTTWPCDTRRTAEGTYTDPA